MGTDFVVFVFVGWAVVELGAALFLWRGQSTINAEIHSVVGLAAADLEARRRRKLELVVIAAVLVLEAACWLRLAAPVERWVHAAACVALLAVNATRRPAFQRWTAAHGRARALLDHALAQKARESRTDGRAGAEVPDGVRSLH